MGNPGQSPEVCKTDVCALIFPSYRILQNSGQIICGILRRREQLAEGQALRVSL